MECTEGMLLVLIPDGPESPEEANGRISAELRTWHGGWDTGDSVVKCRIVVVGGAKGSRPVMSKRIGK